MFVYLELLTDIEVHRSPINESVERFINDVHSEFAKKKL